MSLHYLVKLKIKIAHVLLMSCYREKKIHNLSTLTVAPKFAKFESS